VDKGILLLRDTFRSSNFLLLFFDTKKSGRLKEGSPIKLNTAVHSVQVHEWRCPKYRKNSCVYFAARVTVFSLYVLQ